MIRKGQMTHSDLDFFLNIIYLYHSNYEADLYSDLAFKEISDTTITDEALLRLEKDGYIKLTQSQNYDFRKKIELTKSGKLFFKEGEYRGIEHKKNKALIKHKAFSTVQMIIATIVSALIGGLISRFF